MHFAHAKSFNSFWPVRTCSSRVLFDPSSSHAKSRLATVSCDSCSALPVPQSLQQSSSGWSRHWSDKPPRLRTMNSRPKNDTLSARDVRGTPEGELDGGMVTVFLSMSADAFFFLHVVAACVRGRLPHFDWPCDIFFLIFAFCFMRLMYAPPIDFSK